MSDEIKPRLETELDDYKPYAYYIREDAKSRGVENTRLSIYGIYMAVIEKQAAELERYETARQEDARRLKQVKGERAALAESVLTCLKYPRGSEAQIRCLEEVGQDAAALKDVK